MPTALDRAAIAAALLLAHASGAVAQETRDVFADTWVATDGLGRALPTAAQVGPPRPGKTVAVFYFLWLGRHGEEGPFDIPKILATNPDAMSRPTSPPWGPMVAPHHWGESIFGYYTSDDEAVIRKHAQMLADADVDLIVFDVTNQLTYPESWRAVGRVFDRMRAEGNRVPQFAFLCPFGDPRKVVRELWRDLYGPGLHADLWFRWGGKPLILADPAALDSGEERGRRRAPVELTAGHTLGRAFAADRPFAGVGAACPTWATRDSAATLTLYRRGPGRERVASRRFEGVADNAWLMLDLDAPAPAGSYELELSDPKGHVGWWSDPTARAAPDEALADGAAVPGSRTLRIRPADDPDAAIRRFFTFRKPQPDYFQGPTGPDQWAWLEVTPQHPFRDAAGAVEEVAVGVAQNAVDGKLGVFTAPGAYGRSFHDGREPGPEGRDGTGRNFAEQWRRALELDPKVVFVTNWNEWVAGRYTTSNMPLRGAGPVTFVDEFDAEFSRDIEPMVGGHGDNYYYQMVANIRRFKGARPVPAVVPGPIAVDGRFDDWAGVGPEFRDAVGDPARRDHRGWGQGTRHVNATGHNDLVAAKVSPVAGGLAFYARAAEPLAGGPTLLLDVDADPKTGWLGYDVAVNRTGVGGVQVPVERNVGGRFEWAPAAAVAPAVAGRELELTISLAALGLAETPAVLDFKWADNIRGTGEASDLTLNGDCAPNDRFNYRAILRPAVPE